MFHIAFYRFWDWKDFASWRESLRTLARGQEVLGTFLLAPEGLNASLAGEKESLERVLQELERLEIVPRGSAEIKWSTVAPSVQPYRRLFVKLKKELIPVGMPEVKPWIRTGKRLLPRELKEWYDSGKKFLIVDTRNGYELEKGLFRGTVDLGLKTSRKFSDTIKKAIEDQTPLGKRLQSETVVMFCTGGIRCEKATAAAIELGVKDVYQLEGGILRYFQECGREHYQGDCFVFDERVALGPEAVEGRLLDQATAKALKL